MPTGEFVISMGMIQRTKTCAPFKINTLVVYLSRHCCVLTGGQGAGEKKLTMGRSKADVIKSVVHKQLARIAKHLQTVS